MRETRGREAPGDDPWEIETLRGRATSVQLTTQLMKRLRGVHVARSRLHGSLELPKCLPPAPLLEIDAPKVHEREMARLVGFRLLGLPQPGDVLVEFPLLHQVDPDVVIRPVSD